MYHHRADLDRRDRRIRNICAVLATALLVLRVIDLTGLAPIPEAVIAGALVPFAVCVAAAFSCGYKIRARKAEREARNDQWDAAVARREQRIREDEERSWWGEPVDGDTITFAPNVHVLSPRRPRSQAG